MQLRWYNILAVILFYLIGSWGLLWLCDEEALIHLDDFIYWIIVTASTVGYGDLSPSSVAGKWVVALFVIPFGLGLFGLTIGRLAAYVSFQWRKGVRGIKSLNIENHILVVGWNGHRTLQLMRLLLREMAYCEEIRRVVLCVRADIENPMPDEIEFVRVSSFSSDEEMARAGVEVASSIIIDNPDDEITMTCSLYCANRNQKAHIIAYFQQERLGNLLKEHCPNIECMPSVAVEMIAKSAVDPGSSQLHHELLNVDSSMTQYSIMYQGGAPIQTKVLLLKLKEQYEATLIAATTSDSTAQIQLNPRCDYAIAPGSLLYYISDERIPTIDWRQFDV